MKKKKFFFLRGGTWLAWMRASMHPVRKCCKNGVTESSFLHYTFKNSLLKATYLNNSLISSFLKDNFYKKTGNVDN